MTCKIKTALLFDDRFMRAFGEVSDSIKLPYKAAFEFYKVGNELGLAYQKIEETRMEILERHAAKNGKGKIKKDGEGNMMFTDKKAAEEELMKELNGETELNCDKLSNSVLEQGVIAPSLIESIALLSPILDLEITE